MLNLVYIEIERRLVAQMGPKPSKSTKKTHGAGALSRMLLRGGQVLDLVLLNLLRDLRGWWRL